NYPLVDIELSIDKQPSSPNDDADRNSSRIFSRKLLVGGSLVIGNVSMYNPLELDQLKAHYHETCWKISKIFKSAMLQLKLKDIEGSNGNPITNMKVLRNFPEKQIIKPSQQLFKDINEALNNINPYKLLTKVLSEYDYMVCTEITMGGRL
ncbi:7329_t:CDS:2, partial [Funneliformis geosporum]